MLVAAPWRLRAQQPSPRRVPIADMHSHWGMIVRRIGDADPAFADELRNEQVALVAWKMVADGRWIRSMPARHRASRRPGARRAGGVFLPPLRPHARLSRDAQAEDGAHAGRRRRMPGRRARHRARLEGADFLEGRVEALGAAVDKGLRHLQLVHYIRTPVGDFQTKPPVHHGLSAMGRQLVRECNAKGVLVDLAHCMGPAVEQALDISSAPMVWSHGWVDGDGGSWQDPYGYLRRRLSLALARRIAAQGGVIGLWGLGLSHPSLDYPLDAARHASLCTRAHEDRRAARRRPCRVRLGHRRRRAELGVEQLRRPAHRRSSICRP